MANTFKPWTETQNALLRRLATHEQTMQQRMSKYYLAEAKRLDKEIAAFYQKYGKDKVVQYRNVLYHLSEADRELLMRNCEAFVQKYPQYANLLPVRQNIYKLNRLEGLQASVRVQQLEIGAYESQQIEQHLKRVGAEAFEATSKLLGHEYNPEIVKKFVDSYLPGTNVLANVMNNHSKLGDYLSADLAQGMARGDSYARLAENVTQRFKRVSQNDLARLVYTQGTLVYNEATAGVVEEDFEEYQISTAGDSKVCDICRGLEHEVFSFKDRTVGVNFPPLHPWCRCSFTVVIGDRNKWIEDYIKKHNGTEKGAEKLLGSIGDIGVSPIPDWKELIGGTGDAEVTDNIHDYHLPQSVRDRLPEIEKLQTFNDFKRYFTEHGIELETDLQKLVDNADEKIDAVTHLGQQLVVAYETYTDEFGQDALKKLKKIVMYTDSLDTYNPAAYFFNQIGEDDPEAGTIKFRRFNVSGRAVFHELGHCFQDSQALPNEDALLFSDRIADKVPTKNVPKPRASYTDESFNAERMADAFGYGFTLGDKRDTEFIKNVHDYLKDTSVPENLKKKTVKKYGSPNLKNAMGSDYQDFADLIDKAPNRNLYEKYVEPIDMQVTKNDGYANAAGTKAVVKYDSGEGFSKYSTVAHELNHIFDKKCYINNPNVHFNEIDTVNKYTPLGSGKFKTVNAKASVSDEFLQALRKDASNMRQDLLSGKIKSDFLATTEMKNATSGVQDMLDGFFSTQSGKTKYGYLPWGHGEKYYNRKYNKCVNFGNEKGLKQAYLELGFDASNQQKCKRITRIYETASEAWANVGSAVTCGGAELEAVKKYMPETYNAYLQIIGGAQ